jgi:phosphohistidine swiveling domain-containing protein
VPIITESKLLVNLSDTDAATLTAAGGKGSNLAFLAKAGFRVPKGFVVTTEAYSEFLRMNELGRIANEQLRDIDIDDADNLVKTATAIREIIERAPLPEEMVSAIEIAYAGLNSVPVAIRSSATAEDLPDASFAGQYDTSLFIEGIDNVLQHIKRCFSSMWTDRAIVYRKQNNIPDEQVQLAVVIQEMVDARSAGVLFTNNPLSGTQDEIIIESNYGLGESVVSGYVVPDRFIVSKGTSKQKAYSLISREIGTKEVIIERAGNRQGVQKTKPALEQSQSSSLDDNEVANLAEIGDSVEDLFKSPQDVEWAIDSKGNIYVLQARPITVHADEAGGRKDDIFWTRGYADDYWNDSVTPLFYSLLGDQITHIVNVEANAIMGYKNMPKELLKLYKGHVYFNLDVLRTKVVNEMPPFIRSDDVMNYFPEGGGPYGKDTMRELPFALPTRIMAEIRVMLLDGDGSMMKTNSVYETWTNETFDPACKRFDEKYASLRGNGTFQEFQEIADDLDKTMMRHFRMVRYGLPVHTLGMNLITNYLLKRWLGEKAATRLYPILLSGLEHKTSETNARIRKLALSIREDRELTKLILDTPSQNILLKLETDQSTSRPFLVEFNQFLDDFGDRGFTREPYYPRWRESPEYVFDILKSLAFDHSRNLEQTEIDLTCKRGKAEKLVENVIRGQRYGPIKWMLFSTILGMARTYIGFRENQRFNLDRWITRERLAYLEIGRILAEKGILREPIHVFFLYRKELKRIMKSKFDVDITTVQKLVEERYEDFLRYENLTPPKFLRGNREFDDAIPDSMEGYKGMPASHGSITGTVRVLSSVEEVPLVRAGEILIVPRTDPGWTPVFSKIGGLVTETGGILSHGAVVSREFGIPAVTNVRNACQIFKTGQRVTVDGNRGIVSLFDSE